MEQRKTKGYYNPSFLSSEGRQSRFLDVCLKLSSDEVKTGSYSVIDSPSVQFDCLW